MKHVRKGLPPHDFDEWKASGNADWQPGYGELRNPQKRALHEALLREQGWVCCYCGRAIALGDSHIEHFRPQAARPDLALAYDNLFASCIREGEPGAPLHCGHAKGNAFEDARHLSPLDAGVERRYIYALGGAILPAHPEDAAARYMSGLLDLDNAFLRARREAVLALVFDADFLATASDAELRKLADAGRSPDAQGKIESFGHVVARYAEQLLPTPA